MKAELAYKYCVRCGEKAKFIVNRVECLACGYRLYLNPAVCNGIIIQNTAGEILLVKRKFTPKKGLWDVPGGFIEREVREELGVKVQLEHIVGVYADTYLFQGVTHPTLGVIVTGKILSGKIQVADDAAEYAYFSREEIDTLPMAFQCVKQGIADYFNGKMYKRT